jgi:hypothetical protein
MVGTRVKEIEEWNRICNSWLIRSLRDVGKQQGGTPKHQRSRQTSTSSREPCLAAVYLIEGYRPSHLEDTYLEILGQDRVLLRSGQQIKADVARDRVLAC